MSGDVIFHSSIIANSISIDVFHGCVHSIMLTEIDLTMADEREKFCDNN